jgi:GH24 family phage-related lysozyme (muramidase)
MSKKGVSAVSGNTSPLVGEKHSYHIAGWYPDTPVTEKDPSKVTWELFIKRSNGKFTTTNIKKKGTGDFTFGEKALGHTFRLEAYLYKPEGGGLIITPRRDKIPRISKVELFYVDDSRGDTFSFMEKLRARAYTVNLFDEEVVFTLWEDDAKGGGHHKSNTPIATQKTKVDHKGIAVTEFLLSKALMQKAMQGEADPKQLEFYVTVEYYKNKKHATDNVEVNNPFPQTPKPKTSSSLAKAKGSPAEQKPKSKKEEKGIMESIADQFLELWDWEESKGTIKKEQPPTRQKPEGRSPAVVSEIKQEKKEDDKDKLIIFPLLVKPENDGINKWSKDYYWAAKQRANMATYNANRSNGRRHAARDLYTNPYEAVVAIADGEILHIKSFYDRTHQITIRHKLKDGRDFIIRYGELDPESITVQEGDTVVQKQIIGKTGKLLKTDTEVRLKIGGTVVYMLHFEYFAAGYNSDVKKNTLSNGTKPFMRRSDLSDSITILQEGYRNTFGEETTENSNDRVLPSILVTSQKGINFIKDWEKFYSKPYDDSEGYATIGYGYLIAYKSYKTITQSDIEKTDITWNEFNNGISETRAAEIFAKKLKKYEKAVQRDIKVNLHQYEFDALVSLVFNTGSEFLNTGGAKGGETKIKKYINNQMYEQGADEMSDVTNGGTSGLVKRRKAEINMFKNNVYDSTH